MESTVAVHIADTQHSLRTMHMAYLSQRLYVFYLYRELLA